MTPVKLRPRCLLGYIEQLPSSAYYLRTSVEETLNTRNEKTSRREKLPHKRSGHAKTEKTVRPLSAEGHKDHDRSDPLPFQAGFTDDTRGVEQADVSSEFSPSFADQVRETLRRHSKLFRPELGLLSGDARMLIPFKDNNVEGLRSMPYSMCHRDRLAADAILNPLRDASRIESVPDGEMSPITSPAFVVWQHDKPRFVVDIRKVNNKLLLNSYPLPRQDDVLEALAGSMIFSAIDIRKGFF
jgi:hypothetical protein